MEIINRVQHHQIESNCIPPLLPRRSPRIIERNQRQEMQCTQAPLVLRRSSKIIERAHQEALLDAQIKAERKRQRRSELSSEQREKRLEHHLIRYKEGKKLMTEEDKEAKCELYLTIYHSRKSRRVEKYINDDASQQVVWVVLFSTLLPQYTKYYFRELFLIIQ